MKEKREGEKGKGKSGPKSQTIQDRPRVFSHQVTSIIQKEKKEPNVRIDTFYPLLAVVR